MHPLERALQFEGFTLDLRRGCLRGAGGEIELRPKSFEVLRYLIENAGRLVPKDELIKAVWPNLVVTDESLTRCVSDVRLALATAVNRSIVEADPEGPSSPGASDRARSVLRPDARLGRVLLSSNCGGQSKPRSESGSSEGHRFR
jgi:Transcriptional regulatory protein, C terminal